MKTLEIEFDDLTEQAQHNYLKIMCDDDPDNVPIGPIAILCREDNEDDEREMKGDK